MKRAIAITILALSSVAAFAEGYKLITADPIQGPRGEIQGYLCTYANGAQFKVGPGGCPASIP